MDIIIFHPALHFKDFQSKKEIVKDKHCCFRCLNTGHVSRNCKKRTASDIGGCRSHHHRLLHGAPRVFPKKEDSLANAVAAITQKDDQVALSQEPVSFVGVTCPKENITLLPIVPMEIVGMDGNIMEAYDLLDQGSEVTLIDQRAADELGLECEISKTQFHTFHNRDPVINVKEVSVTVSSFG